MDDDTTKTVSPEEQPEDAAEISLRPRTLDEFIGQEKMKARLRIYIQAARQRNEPLDHALFSGPPGLGKTTLAHIIANELGVDVHITGGPAVEHKGMLAGLLTNLEQREVLFVDEIHRLNPAVEEYLYPAMEDRMIDVQAGTGAFSETIRLNLKAFTLVGATTRSGLLTSPLRDRFGIVETLDLYLPEEMTRIVLRSAKLLGVQIAQDAAAEVGRRSRGTPRIANRLLSRVRDYADVKGDGTIDMAIARHALAAHEIDDLGLTKQDRALLRAIIEKYGGGPVGVDALAAAMHEERDTLENVMEPFLIQQAFIQRTPRGREAMPLAYRHLGIAQIPDKKGGQGTLF